MVTLAPQYRFIDREPGPRILMEMRALIGTMETPGPGNNPVIMGWSRELGPRRVGMDYNADSIPWCGIGVGIAALRAGFEPPPICARASSWDAWGTHVPLGQAMLGDVLRFQRPGGGHVGLYVGEDARYYHVMGANQSDSVNVTLIEKSRCVAIRRCPWRMGQPVNVRKIILAATGPVSKNES